MASNIYNRVNRYFTDVAAPAFLDKLGEKLVQEVRAEISTPATEAPNPAGAPPRVVDGLLLKGVSYRDVGDFTIRVTSEREENPEVPSILEFGKHPYMSKVKYRVPHIVEGM